MLYEKIKNQSDNYEDEKLNDLRPLQDPSTLTFLTSSMIEF